MRVIDEDTGKEFILDSTPEYQADMEAHWQSLCQHEKAEIRRRPARGGAVHFYRQCLTCGESVGSAVGRANVPSEALPWDDVLGPRYRAKKDAERKAITQKHVRIQREGEAGFWKNYNEYLKTDEWRAKRAKVIERAGSLCEGCRQRPASQVHHLTYKHVFAEFMFELVAVCDECHDRLHADDTGEQDEDERFDETEWYDGHVCEGCRWQSEQDHKRWCGILHVSAKDALKDGGDCGPKHALFEPLR